MRDRPQELLPAQVARHYSQVTCSLQSDRYSCTHSDSDSRLHVACWLVLRHCCAVLAPALYHISSCTCTSTWLLGHAAWLSCLRLIISKSLMHSGSAVCGGDRQTANNRYVPYILYAVMTDVCKDLSNTPKTRVCCDTFHCEQQNL